MTSSIGLSNTHSGMPTRTHLLTGVDNLYREWLYSAPDACKTSRILANDLQPCKKWLSGRKADWVDECTSDGFSSNECNSRATQAGMKLMGYFLTGHF